MPTVGDVLFAVRSKIPDMPPALPAPGTLLAPQSVSSILTLGGTSFTITMVGTITPAIGTVVIYTAGSDATFNGSYTVTALLANNQFSATGTSHAAGTSTGGTLANVPIVTPLEVGSSTFPVGTYYAVVTQRNPWGETLATSEFGPLIIPGGGPPNFNAILVSCPLLPGATTIRVYLTQPGGASGSEIQFVESTTTPFSITAPVTGFGTPPTRSTAWLLDSDGPQFGASTLYQWLNEGLNKFTRAAGGLLDYSGVPTVVGQPLYVLPGEWREISDVWYGGYWVQGGKRAEFFRRNTVTTSVLSRVTVSVFTDKQVIEVCYQPDRTSGVTATTANMAATDTQVAIANTGAFLLPFGFAQIGTEIVAYANLAGGLIAGLIRGLGSTVAQAWPSTTTVTELSLFWCGKRLTLLPYSPGQSLLNLAVPQGWVAIIPNYMLAQAKKAELDLEAAEKLEQTFFREVKEWMEANKPVAQFVQVGGSLGSRSGTLTFDQVLGQGVVVP